MVGLEGFEPPTHGLGNRCSIRLSYRPACVFNSLWMHFGPHCSFCCPNARDRCYESLQITSSIVLISLIGKR